MTDREPEAAEQYHDGNERDVASKQRTPVADSEAIKRDDEVDADAVTVLPGTGGPDDVGDVDLDPGEYHRDGRA